MYFYLKEIIRHYEEGRVSEEYMRMLLKEKSDINYEEIVRLKKAKLDKHIEWSVISDRAFVHFDPENCPEEGIKILREQYLDNPRSCCGRWDSPWTKKWIPYFGEIEPELVTAACKKHEAQSKPLNRIHEYNLFIPELGPKGIDAAAKVLINTPPTYRMILLSNKNLSSTYFNGVLSGFSQIKEHAINDEIQKRLEPKHLSGLNPLAQIRILLNGRILTLVNALGEPFIDSILLSNLFNHKDKVERVRTKIARAKEAEKYEK